MFRRFAYGMVLTALLLALFTVPTSAADTSYSDALGRFTFMPPNGFSLDLEQSYNGYANFSRAGQQAAVEVFAFLHRAESQSLDEYVNGRITNFKRDSGFHLISPQPQAVSVDGIPARQFEYLFTNDSGTRHFLVTYALNGNVMARFNAYAPDSAWNAFQPQAAMATIGFHFLTAAYPTTYTDGQNRYSFTIPLGWQHDLSLSHQDGTKDGFVGFSPEGDLYIDPIPAETDVTFDQYVASALSDLILANPTIETSQKTAVPTTIANLPAFQWEYFDTADNVRYHHRLVWFVSGTTLYRLSINTRDDRWDAFMPQAMLVINSLALT
ncbi:MAG: hypothetical protein M3Y58_17070 [Chloroflexota bacterium]|nr:hypothetical protein [Chloroflexota bacterium]